MTCIAALVSQDRVFVGGDSAGVAGYDLTVRADEKVFVNGPYVMGFCQSFRLGDLLRYQLKPPSPGRAVDLRRFMATKFIDAVREVLKTNGLAEKDDNVESFDGSFIVGIRGRMFVIDSDFQVGEPRDPFAAIGCGGQIAQGALYAQPVTMKPEARIRQALRAAERFSGGVRAPFVVRSI